MAKALVLHHSQEYGNTTEMVKAVADGLKESRCIDDHHIYDVRKKLEGLRYKPFVLFYSHGGGGRGKDIMPRIFSRIGTLIFWYDLAKAASVINFHNFLY